MEHMSSRWLKIFFSLSLLAVLLLFLMSIGDLVKLFIISALLAYIIDPVAVFLESRGLSRTSSTAVIFLSFFVIAGIFVLLFLPLITREMSAIQEAINSGQASVILSRIEVIIRDKLGFLGIEDINLSDKLHSALTGLSDWFFSHLFDIVALVTDLVIVPFMIFFLLKDGREMKKQLVKLVPNRYFEFSLNLLYKMDRQLGNYLRGQFMDAVIFGTLSVVALWALNVKYFFIIGIFAGLANLIPFLGPVVGAGAAIIVSVIDTGNFTLAGYIVLAFIGMKLIDDGLVQPVVVARSVDMHPLVVLLAVIIGGKFFGVLGMLLSVPFTGFIKVVIEESIINFRKYHLT